MLSGRAPAFPGDPEVQVSTVATVAEDGYYLQRLTCGEQSGTHWAAPAHFSPGERAADDLDPADFFFPAAVLDHRSEASADPDFAVTTVDIVRWEAVHGRIPDHAAVLLLSGYDRRWHDEAAYLGTGHEGGLRYPGFSAQAAGWLIERRRIGALGTDTMGVDPGADPGFGANRLLLRGHRMHLENLRGLDQMPPTGGWIIVGGIRPAGGSGSPATIFGLIP